MKRKVRSDKYISDGDYNKLSLFNGIQTIKATK